MSNEQEVLDVDGLFEELEAIMINRWPTEEYGEDSDLSSIYSIAEELKNECKSLREQLAELKTALVTRDGNLTSKILTEQLAKERELRKELVIMLDVAKDDIANEWTHIQIESLIQKAKDKSHE